AVGAVALAGVLAWGLAVPDGIGATATFLGFQLRVVVVDDVSRLLVIAFGGFGTAAVAYAYAAGADRRLLAVALGYVAAAVWTVSVGDWLALVLGWEAMAATSTVLVWLHGGDAVRAGYRYALVHALGGGLLLAGVAAQAASAGAIDVSGAGVAAGAFGGATGGIPANALHFDGTGVDAGLPAILVGLGVAVNAAVIGLHGWLPDTYPRPHVAASVFLCVFTTKSAVYAAYRAFPEGNLALAYVGGAMAVYGAGYALAQKDVRRLLSYHIQAQVGYMLAGIGVGSALGVAGGFAHLFNNVLYKGLLFMIAGIVIHRTGRNRLDRFGALGTSAPVALAAFLVAALSIAAFPGSNGFVSKGMVIGAVHAVDVLPVAGGEDLLWWLLILGGVGTYASFLKFGYYAFLDGEPERIRDASAGHAAVTLAIAGACVYFGVRYEALFALLPASDAWTAHPYTAGHLLESVAIAVAGVVAFLLGKPLLERLHGGVDVDHLHDPAVFYGTRAASGAAALVAGRLGGGAARVGWGSAAAVRNPQRTLRRLLPERLHDWYGTRVERTVGETGLKLGIDPSIYVAMIVLALAIAIALQ
ncbi:MAG: proton-conducting transporter membrane subunit, partial [Haloferacaceae archaeon]